MLYQLSEVCDFLFGLGKRKGKQIGRQVGVKQHRNEDIGSCDLSQRNLQLKLSEFEWYRNREGQFWVEFIQLHWFHNRESLKVLRKLKKILKAKKLYISIHSTSYSIVRHIPRGPVHIHCIH